MKTADKSAVSITPSGHGQDGVEARPGLVATWRGPFAWPRRYAKTVSIPREPGVYLLCFEFGDGYLVYAAGITGRTVPQRLSQHRTCWETGIYTVLDRSSLAEGRRTELWHGFFMRNDHSADKYAEFAARKDEIVAAAREEMAAIRIFTACITEPRIRARMEAAIMQHLWAQPPPFGAIPDRGMHLEPRRADERPILLRNVCESKLHTLPDIIEI